MKRIMIVPALLALWAQPALAGDWDETYTSESYRYEGRSGGGDYRIYDALPAYGAPYVSDGYVITEDAPLGYGSVCDVEQQWSPGRYRETVECEED